MGGGDAVDRGAAAAGRGTAVAGGGGMEVLDGSGGGGGRPDGARPAAGTPPFGNSAISRNGSEASVRQPVRVCMGGLNHPTPAPN